MLCKDAGLIVPPEVVDHIDGKGPKGERGFDETNLRALCKRCHDRLDAQNRARKGCDANGYPL